MAMLDALEVLGWFARTCSALELYVQAAALKFNAESG